METKLTSEKLISAQGMTTDSSYTCRGNGSQGSDKTHGGLILASCIGKTNIVACVMSWRIVDKITSRENRSWSLDNMEHSGASKK